MYWTGIILLLSFMIKTTDAQEYHFTFNPPDTTFTEILNIRKSTLIDNQKEKDDEIITETRIKIEKNNNGYYLYKTPVKMNSKRNGQPFNNPLFTFLTNIETKAVLNENGEMLTVFGYETMIPRAKEELSAELMDQLILVANETSMINKAKADWNARISDFSNQIIKLGDLFTGQGIFPLPNGEKLTFFSAIKISNTVKYNNTQCIKIRFKNSSNPKDLLNFLEKDFDKIQEIYNIDANTNLDTKIKISGEGYRIIDPKTMLLQYEINNRYIEMTDQIIGEQSRNRTIIESKEYKYIY